MRVFALAAVFTLIIAVLVSTNVINSDYTPWFSGGVLAIALDLATGFKYPYKRDRE